MDAFRRWVAIRGPEVSCGQLPYVVNNPVTTRDLDGHFFLGVFGCQHQNDSEQEAAEREQKARSAESKNKPRGPFVQAVETCACRMSFCCTPTGAPVSSSQARYV